MNKKAAYALRLVLGAYLAYLGVKLIIQMVQERPTNMILMCALSVVFVIVGGGYAIYSLKKLLDIRKEERGTAVSDEPDEESGSAAVNPNAVSQMDMQSTEIRKAQKHSTVKETAGTDGRTVGDEDASADSEVPVAREESADKDDKKSLAEADPKEEKEQGTVGEETEEMKETVGEETEETKETIEEEIENDYEEK